jgi:hypothetical protein
MTQIKYISITNIRFDNEGNIIRTTNADSTINYPAVRSSDTNVSNSTAWSEGKTIFELQNKAFGDLKDVLRTAPRTENGGSNGDINEPPSLEIYYNAIISVVNYNNQTRQIAEADSSLTEYPKIVFYNQYNEGIDYRQYENMLKTRDFIKAKMDYINNVPGTLSHEQNINYMNGIYTSTLVSILATSLLYLVFVHLR